jgi:hypothetical protein
MSSTSLLLAAVACALAALTPVRAAEFTCPVGSSPLACVCSLEAKPFTSSLCSYFNQANATADFASTTTLLKDNTSVVTLFAINNSAYSVLTSAETSAYTSSLEGNLKYLVVGNNSYTLAALRSKPNFALPTADGATQLILVTTASNNTVLNDDDTCTVSTCKKAGAGSVCLVGCVLAPTDGLGTIAIIGIVVAGVAAACLIVACLFNIFRKDPAADEDADDGTGAYQTVDAE